MTTVEDERTLEDILAPLATVPPARRAARRRRRGRWLVPVALAAVVALFVAVQPRGGRPSIEARAMPNTAPSPDVGQLAARFAQSVVGAPFRWGGAAPTGFDPSGLVVWSFGQAGRPGLPHFSGSLWSAGPRVRRSALRAGDLVFFMGLTHVGIYVGHGRFVHATPAHGVTVTSLGGTWAKRYDGAVRVTAHVVDNQVLDVRWRARGRTGLLHGGMNVVVGTERPMYVVRVANLGETWQLRLQVRLVVPGRPPTVKAIPALGPGAVGSVTLTAPTPSFVRPIPMRFMVVPVSQETVLTNNAVTYRIQYELQ
jgi:hypothetical protein